MNYNPTSFLIVWTELNQYEHIEDFEDGPHAYAYSHLNYGKSKYFFVDCATKPDLFLKTPEDTLLDSIFSNTYENDYRYY